MNDIAPRVDLRGSARSDEVITAEECRLRFVRIP
jgi:hypothetical protein